MASGTKPGGRLHRMTARAGLAAAGLLVVFAGLFAAPSALAQQTNDLPWSATMTIASSSAEGHGYSEPNSTGALDDDTLTYNGTATTVSRLGYRFDFN